jgi:hypothetical protein
MHKTHREFSKENNLTLEQSLMATRKHPNIDTDKKEDNFNTAKSSTKPVNLQIDLEDILKGKK